MKHKRFFVVLLALLPLMAARLCAQEPYALLSNDYKTLTFYYDDKKEANGGMSVGPFEYSGDRGWYSLQYEIKNVVFTPSFADCTSLTSTALWFCNCKNLTSISGLEYLKTDNVTDMNRMFMGCESLTVIDATHFNTENVTKMDYMFYDCINLANLDVSGFKTAKVESMECMFRDCSSLASMNVSNFNTANVQHLSYMFSNCASLTSIDVSSFDTAKSFDTDHMFNGCSNLTSLDLSSFNTAKMTHMASMFNGCSGLTTIYAGDGWSTASVTSGEDMFTGCTSLVGGNGTPYNDSHTDYTYAHVDAEGNPGYLTYKAPASSEPYAVLINDGTVLKFFYDDKKEDWGGGMSVGPFDDYDARGWSDYVLSIKSVVFDASFADCTSLTSTAYWFSGCSNLTAITGIENLKTDNVTDMVCMFMNCYSLTSLDVKGFKTENVSNMQAMFSYCSGLTSLEVSGFKTDNVTDMLGMFAGCHSLTSLDVSGFMTENVTSMFGMFDECQNLTSLDVTGFKTDNVTNMSYMFHGCPGLTSLDVTGFNTENVTDMAFMFCACYGLTSLDVSSFNTAKVTNMEYMFNSCSGLTTIYAGDGWSTASVTNGENMFTGCTSLVGGNGTPYNDSHTDYTYAHVDAEGNPGYLTYKAPASSEPYAVLINDGTVLKFFYDNKKVDNGGMSVGPFDSANSRGWHDYRESIVSVIFDPSFAGCTTLTSTANWFNGCIYLTNITGIENLKTDNVTDMAGMFYRCNSLTSVDVSHFNTENVEDMYFMFGYCFNLTSLDVSTFNTANVTDMGSMFENCLSLSSLNLGLINTAKVENMENMFWGCDDLISLDLSSFNTTKVTNMAGMFNGCSMLSTIYAGIGWTTANVTVSNDMFYGCTGLAGGNGTEYTPDHTDAEYARIDEEGIPGYLTYKITGVCKPYAILSEGTLLTFYYDDRMEIRDGLSVGPFNDYLERGWNDYKSMITSVVFHPSFAECTSLTSTAYWFSECSNLTSITNIENLKTDNVVNMRNLFDGCYSLTSLDVSSFKTDKVKDMQEMFSRCSGLTSLDLSSFQTDNVTDMSYMFYYCSGLATIYVGSLWSTASVTNGDDMFVGCTNLVGGHGTLYDANFTDKEYARIDEDGKPGYLTDINGPLPYALLSEGNTVLTFYYDDQKAARNGMGVGPFSNVAPWYSSHETITSVVFDSSFADCPTLTSTAWWFYGCKNLNGITDIENLKTDKVKSMYEMFAYCESLKSLDVSHFNTENVTTMRYMFYGCKSLTSLDLKNFNTGKVRNMDIMFYDCSSLTSLDLSNFKTEEVTDMSWMFSNCTALANLDISNFNTANVLYMYRMFEGCSSLTSIDVSHFNTDKLMSIGFMFVGCSALPSIDVTNFNTSNVQYMDGTFEGCTSLTSLDLSNFDTSSATMMSSMFNGCSNLTTIYASDHWMTASVTESADMFTGCTSLVGGNGTPYNDSHTDHTYARIDEDGNPGYFTYKAPASSEPYAVLINDGTVLKFFYDDKKEDWGGGMSVGPFSTSDSRPWYPHAANITSVVFDSSFAGCTTLTSTAFWFYGFSNLTSITGIEYLKTDNVKNMMEMFHGCSSLTTLDVSNFNTENVERLDALFQDCAALTSLNLIHFNTAKVMSMRDMFHGCSSLTSLDLSSFNTSNVTVMFQLFSDCSSLTSLDISNFNTAKVTSMSNLFNGCSSLTSLDVHHFVTSEVTNMQSMFYGCSGLTSLDVTNFDTSKVTEMRSMFNGCSGLTTLDLTNFNTSEVLYMNFMFEGCSGLTSLDLHNFNTSKVLYTNDMFYGCANLLTLDISGFDMTNVTSLSGMFSHCSSLASIQLGNAKIPDIILDAISNPNLLVYVNSSEAVPSGIQNVVVNDEAEEIVLTFTWEGNGNFYCPKQFMAHKIRYIHEFSMETVIGVSRGWETIALPFTVQSITHEKNGPLAPFGAEGGKPFWLGQMTPQGLVAAQQIVANVPYVISMPNNALYPDSYNQNGSVTFSATNCVVPMTEQHAMSSDKCTMVPTFQRVDQSPDVYAINLYDAYGSHPEGSIFVANLREVRPFEAYTLHSSGSRQFFSIDKLVADPTGIQEMVFMKNDGNEKVYNLKGQRLATPQKGVNIMNGRKVVIK